MSKSTERKQYPRQYICFVKTCDLKFETMGQRLFHINEAHGGQIVCPHDDCGTFLKASYIRHHMQAEHGKRIDKTTCTKCRRRIVKFYYLRHKARCWGESATQLNCEVEGCKSFFTNKVNLVNHMKTVHVEPIECPHKDCKSHIKPAALRRHLKTVHDNSKIKCENCGKKVSLPRLDVHAKKCSPEGGEKTLTCSFEGCEASFKNQQSRSKHIRNIHQTFDKVKSEDIKADLTVKTEPDLIKTEPVDEVDS